MYRYKNNVYAVMHGKSKYPDINGMVTFGRTKRGVLLTAEIYGLPDGNGHRVYPFCIHNGSCMSLDENGNFAKGEGYFNPSALTFPLRAGDLPPLFSCGGYAYMQVVTNRFLIEDIIGKSVIIGEPDGSFFSSFAPENTGKVACGIVLNAG